MRHGLGLLTLSALVAAPMAARAADRPPIYAMVVGADSYQSFPKLRGAVNDARTIAQALGTAGAREVVLLPDAAATRANIMTTFADLAAKASRDGGWVVFTYAGHGGQEPERVKGDEVDGMDETLLLPGFARDRAHNGERIFDNDIYALFAAAPKNVTILFVSDSCHSGTMSRSTDPRASLQNTRQAPPYTIVDDSLRPPPPDTRGKSAEELPNVIFVASSLDSEVTPEVAIEGQPHGAVSWNVAKALEGAADANHDGETTFAEFRQYVTVNARQQSESRQTPSVRFLPGREQEVFAPAIPGDRNKPAPSLSLPRLGVWASTGPQAVSGVPGAVAAGSRDAADLVWDQGARQIVSNQTSDLIAEMAPGSQQSPISFVAGVVDKWRAMPGLRRLAGEHPLTVDIAPGGAGVRYGARDPVAITLGHLPSGDLRYLTVVNLAGDGTVQNLFPSPKASKEAEPRDQNYAPVFNNCVSPPYGADHVVAIATAENPQALRTTLRALEQRQASSEAIVAISGAVAGKAYAIGVTGLYTSAAPGKGDTSRCPG